MYNYLDSIVKLLVRYVKLISYLGETITQMFSNWPKIPVIFQHLFLIIETRENYDNCDTYLIVKTISSIGCET